MMIQLLLSVLAGPTFRNQGLEGQLGGKAMDAGAVTDHPGCHCAQVSSFGYLYGFGTANVLDLHIYLAAAEIDTSISTPGGQTGTHLISSLSEAIDGHGNQTWREALLR
jgi:hypothetical protein